MIDVPRLRGPQMHSVPFSYYLNSIQFVKKDLVEKKIFLIRKKKKKEKDVHVYFINIYLRGLLKRELKIFILPGLGRKDSNLRIPGPKPVALPLGDAPFQFRFGTNKEYQWYWLFVNSSPKPQNSILILVLGF